jgi:phosphoribosylglycinamide formyltransferase-1
MSDTTTTSATERMPIVVLISGGGTNLQALIDDAASPAPYQVVGVISNRPGVRGLERATAAGIPVRVIDHQQFDGRDSFDKALAHAIDQLAPRLVVLAGFMRILTDRFVQHFDGRMINIHPSLLPAFQGLHTHQRALDSGVKKHGASVHFVTGELDGGPVIAQAEVAVARDDNADTLAARVLAREHQLLPQVVRWFAEGKLALQGEQVVLNGQPLAAPVQL